MCYYVQAKAQIAATTVCPLSLNGIAAIQVLSSSQFPYYGVLRVVFPTPKTLPSQRIASDSCHFFPAILAKGGGVSKGMKGENGVCLYSCYCWFKDIRTHARQEAVEAEGGAPRETIYMPTWASKRAIVYLIVVALIYTLVTPHRLPSTSCCK